MAKEDLFPTQYGVSLSPSKATQKISETTKKGINDALSQYAQHFEHHDISYRIDATAHMGQTVYVVEVTMPFHGCNRYMNERNLIITALAGMNVFLKFVEFQMFHIDDVPPA